MKKIMFVCHGNICRSPMAEFVMKKMVREAELSDKIANNNLNRIRFKAHIFRKTSPKNLVISAYYRNFSARLPKNLRL